MMRLVGLFLGAMLLSAAAREGEPQVAQVQQASPAVTMQTGNHRGFGRISVAVEQGPAARASREGERVVILLPGRNLVAGAMRPPRNVQALRGGAGRAEIVMAPGAGVRITRRGPRLFVDVMDPPPIPPIVDAANAAGPDPPTTLPRMLPDPAPPVLQATSAAVVKPAALAVATEVSASGGIEAVPAPTPAALAVQPVAPEQGGGFLLPLDMGVGAAAFRRGAQGIIVFDQRRPLDLAGLRGHPMFGGASVQLLPGGTLLRIPLPPDKELALTRQPQGWRLAMAAPAISAEPIRTSRVDDKLLFATTAAAAVVPISDPETGATLLVGTVRGGVPAMPVTRNWATQTALRSVVGLVVEPLSDDLTLRAGADGFTLSGGPAGLPLGDDLSAGERMARAEQLTRRFAFTDQSQDSLRNLQRTQLQEAAEAPPLARGPKRRALAQTLLSLGLAPEAQTILQIAAADDPREAELPETIGLTAIAALLSGRMDEASGLDDPRLADGDETRFWRAVRAALGAEDAPAAASDFAATVPLLLSYPAPLRQRLLPLVAETMLLSGQAEAGGALLERFADDPRLAYARALRLQAVGQLDKALAALDALAAGRDRLLRARAGARAAELRLARADLTPATAAAALERLLFAWRGDARDLALRLRVADLRVQAGTWRPALALLRETEALFPDNKAMIQARQVQSVAQLLQESAMEHMSPLDLVALVDENADLLPGGEAGVDIAARLSDRLMALDLPRRAAPLLQKLVASSPAGPARARFGARLAALLLREADATGARAALDASGAEGLPAALAEERSVLSARAQARLGDPIAAVAQLASLDSDGALRARAAILEETHNWPQAAEALRALVARAVPPEGTLDDAQQRVLLRLATAAAQAGDSGSLGQLRAKELPRLAPGPVADLFRLLTADSVQGVADLPRAGRELALARALAAEPARR